ncbi:hybrid sensor histidine kinase/response regulator [Pseudoalteromonas denitrificans]|uniref:histidine kinase n=1 Tax=Pseudoalteromonas denitrificans DSM 6059 TaxID=1123010 RepID=A0A1I1E5E3_9GAMM|nr:hybrid sensor histidine kinase/response regulator [Pseudoalteromonas denitrificans]SFB82297.1 Histidine kinase-, DNA gyrase B-, and HSP90-like ATPase [Pseudoalteromonas denitrificans DSM 6059]
MTETDIDVSGSKILIVDDKKENLELLTEILEVQGYDIAFAQDGLKALEVASLFLPDLILLDVMMPGIDGFETCKRMKLITSIRDIPIIFVTARTDISDVVAGFKIGAIDYVTKPIRHEEIIARVATHIKLRRLFTIRDELINQLREKNIELENLAKAKDKKLEESEKLSHIGELVGELTHELCTPLGIINTAVSTVIEKNKELESDVVAQKLSKSALENYLYVSRESFDISLSNVRYANQLVSSFKEIVVGEFSEIKTKFELKHFLEDIFFLMMPKIKRSPHSIEINCPRNIILNAQGGALSQVIINLINNSLNHAFNDEVKGAITINVSIKLENVIIKVSDNGKGINTEDEGKIFDKYFSTRMGEGGSGLGLFITQKLIEQKLNGEIRYETNKPQGACFYIYLPYEKL